MAWNPFGVMFEISATAATVTRISATQYTVKMNVAWETYYSGAQTKYGMSASSGGATVTITPAGNNASSGSATLTGTYSISGNAAATKTASVVFKNFSDTGAQATKTIATNSFTVPAWTSYTVSYNANGGKGAPSSQTKWKNQTLKLSSTKPTRTGYTFLGWSASASDTVPSFSAGADYEVNAAITLYAVWKANTYTVKYNANGGTGAPANQTKTYGLTLKLSSTKPTRTNHTFKGWAISASATAATYAAGANFTENVNITLYAVWELNYTNPRITNYTAVRGTYDGSTFTEDSNGTYMKLAFDYECDAAGTEYEAFILDTEGTSLFYVFGELDGDLSGSVVAYRDISEATTVDASYTVLLDFYDNIGHISVYTTLNGAAYTVDFLAGGKGVAFGKPAEIENLCDIQFQTRLNGGLLYPLLPAETDLNTVRTPNTYIGENVAHYNYENCPVTNGTFTLTVESCGDAGQVKQTFTTCSKYKPEAYSRFYYQESWGDWWVASTDEVVLYENNSGTTGAITFQLGSNASDNPAASNYRYLEIYYTDNNGKSGGYTKVWNPNGKTVCLSIVEASSTIYSRQTMYTISGSTITPSVDTAGYFRITSAGAVSTSIGTNYIKIVRIIGRA